MDRSTNSNPYVNDGKKMEIKKSAMVWNRKLPNEIGIVKFQKQIERKYNKRFDSYWDLHKWSIENFEIFWEEMWDIFDMIVSTPYEKVYEKTGSGILDCKWFTGARLNVAENILRIRNDTIGLIYADELGNRGEMTFAEVYAEVKRYACAFRKHGLGVGDRVGGYISNIKEAFFSFLAVVSIGAIWGAIMPYIGPRAVSNVMKLMNPKFIISVDYFHLDDEKFYPIDNLPIVTQGIVNLENVIIVPTIKETLTRDISNIPKSAFLDEFLASGKPQNNEVPDLVFEQLPANHPFTIQFTSGTTGIPKGAVHPAAAVIGLLRDFVLHLNLKSGDVVLNYSPVGWAIWVYTLPGLALGVKQFLFNGGPVFENKGRNIWNEISENEVTYVFISSGDVDDMEERNLIPDPGTNLDCLKIISMSGSPPKPRNYEFLLNKVKRDLFIGSMYGATETMGTFSGYNLNMPLYACECQVSALGVDLHCFDSEGISVIGERGELVITTPTPSLPMYLWGDTDNAKITESYFSKYGKGVWCQNDEGYFNPQTKGYSVLGRSDNVLKQFGERMSPDDIYIAIDHMEELDDFICVCQESRTEEPRSVLFLKMKKGYSYTPEVKEKITQNIHKEMPLDCVPEVILEIPDIPYNITHKRMESTVKKIINTNNIPAASNILNPECLQYYCDIPELVNYI